jgi:hypothetical protein
MRVRKKEKKGEEKREQTKGHISIHTLTQRRRRKEEGEGSANGWRREKRKMMVGGLVERERVCMYV